MFRIILFLLLILPTKVFAYGCSDELDNISKKYQIQIYCHPTEVMKENDIRGESPSLEDLQEFTPFLKTFLNYYPASFVKQHVEKIYILKDLTLKGVKVAGLSSGPCIWIKAQHYYGEHSEFYLRVLNHEFSSSILRKDFLEYLNWKNFSDKKYDESRDFSNKNMSNFEFSRETNQKLLNDGFIFNYGKTNPENDFNTYAELLFTDSQKLKTFASSNNLVRKKLNFLKNVYRNAGYTGKFPDET